MITDNTRNLRGLVFGSWNVIAFEEVKVTAERRGKRKGPARRAVWHCRCIICYADAYLRADYLSKQPVHRPCQKAFRERQKANIIADAVAIFGVEQ